MFKQSSQAAPRSLVCLAVPAADGDLEWIRHPQAGGKRLPEIPGLLRHTRQQITVGKPLVKRDTGTRNTAQADL